MEFVPSSHKVRMEVTTKGVVDTRAYDGAIGWAVLLSEGKTEPERLTGDALKDMKATADFQGALFDPDTKGSEVEYLGKSELAGQPVYKLKLTRSDGEESTVYLDAKTYLEIREDANHSSRSETSEEVTTFSDFKTVDGITMPFTIETKSRETLGGGMIRMEGSVLISIEKVELNVDIPASRFSKPKPDAKKDS
jgi:outer membrane lipoprotein-sorting protein